MREIIFKAKRLDNGEWIEGCLNYDPDLEIAQIEGFNYYISETGLEREFVSELVDPETVCQYTGLKDKNGRRIFEGDMVSTDIKRPYLIVEFRDASFMFNCNDGGKDYYDIMFPILDEPHTAYEYGEVIGNIFDNPELPEVE